MLEVNFGNELRIATEFEATLVALIPLNQVLFEAGKRQARLSVSLPHLKKANTFENRTRYRIG